MRNSKEKKSNNLFSRRKSKSRYKIVILILFIFISLIGVKGYFSINSTKSILVFFEDRNSHDMSVIRALTEADDSLEMSDLHENLKVNSQLSALKSTIKIRRDIVVVMIGSFLFAFILAYVIYLIIKDLNNEVIEKRVAEKALRASEEKYKDLYDESKKAETLYRSLLHTSADAIVIYDLEGKALYVNPSFTRIFGWTQEEIEGRIIPFVPDFEKVEVLSRIRDIIEHGKSVQGFETRRYTKDGQVIEVDISGSRYDNHEGEPAGMLVIIRDKTEKRELEAQLAYAQKMQSIGTLAGGTAHNFNNLLTGIQGNVSLMLLDKEPDDPEYDRLINIQKLVENGSKLTYQLLGYAREGKYEVKPINLNRLVKETSNTFGLTRKEIVIHHDLVEDLHGIRVDQGQIEQTLLNFYVNALDAMPKGGELFLMTSNVTHTDMSGKSYKPKPGNYVLLSVKDTGIGMDKETRKRIFEPFFTTKGLANGTGLGLASAYGIIKGHGGYIDVFSELGHGATFNIYLPATGRIVKEEDKMNSEIIKGNETILFVDDEEQILEVGREMLKNIGYTVHPAKSGQEALDIYNSRQNSIDMVLLDMVMPNMNGGETYDKLKGINPEIIVLLSSGYSLDGQAVEILKRGCKGFIQKPFTLNELSTKIREVLGTIPSSMMS